MESRNVCFTLNNPTLDNIISFLNFNFKYLIFGFEKGKSGTDHLQGYMELWRGETFNYLAKHCCGGVHWEKRKGTKEQAINYCKKDDEYYEFGIIPEQGKRKDLTKIRDMILNGESMEKVANEHFGDFVRYHRGFEKFQEMTNKLIAESCDVTIWTGKSKIEMIDWIEDTFISSHYGDLDGYNGEDVVVFELNQPESLIYRLAKSIPISIKSGYLYKKVLPHNVVVYNPFLSKDEEYFDYITVKKSVQK